MKLPRDVSGAEVVKVLKRLGFEFSRQSGSHAILRKGSCTVVVPQHRSLKPGTLRGVIEQAGLSLQEFCDRL